MLSEFVFLGVANLWILAIYVGAVLFIGSWIAIGVAFVVGVLTGSTFITFAVTGVVLLIYLMLAVLFYIGMMRAFFST
ncbi:MAG: hypothetical protein M3P49_16865 [Actinomycetota bacterium]|nr:hypothetical protein [Actinomycetota bacterium]